MHTSSLMFEAGPAIKIDASQQQNGLLFRSEDGKRILQATLNGFTFNRLAPYITWEDFSGEARYLWEIYKDICSVPLSLVMADKLRSDVYSPSS